MRKQADVWLVDNGDYWKAVWNDPLTGKRASKSIGRQSEVSRRQARNLCRDIENDLHGRTTGEALKLSAWLTTYENFRSDVKETTRRTYRQCAQYLLAHFAADPRINQITRADASAWQTALQNGSLAVVLNQLENEAVIREHLRRTRHVWRKPALATVRRHVRAARTMFREAAQQDRIPFNPFDRLVGTPPKVTKNWAEITPADLIRILDACPSNGWRALFALARLNGLRLGEGLSLAWGDIDWGGNRIRVHERLEIQTSKEAFRVTPIEPARCPTGMTALLRGWFEAAPVGQRRPCDGVSPHSIDRNARAIVRRAGLEKYAKPFHTLRKNRISEVALEYPQGVIEDWFGHDAQVSRDHYQRVPDELYVPPDFGHGLDTEAYGGSAERTRRQTGVRLESVGVKRGKPA